MKKMIKKHDLKSIAGSFPENSHNSFVELQSQNDGILNSCYQINFNYND